jgi:hypothetical protein
MKSVAVILAGCGLASALAILPRTFTVHVPTKPDWDPTWGSTTLTYANRHTKGTKAPCPPVKHTSVAPSGVPSSVTTTSVPTTATTSVPTTTTTDVPTTTTTDVPTTTTTDVPTTTTTTTDVPTTTTTTTDVPTTTTTDVPTTTTVVEPPVRTCELGTAFGYQGSDSVTLNTQDGNGCNRWGWFSTPTLAELQTSIGGVLYVGAGGNNIANAVDVGTWTASANPTGGVTVTYSLSSGYFLDEVHIDLDCLPIDTCAPGQYTFNAGALPNVPVYANPTPLQYPACPAGSVAYLILHASVNYLTTAPTCAPPVAT